MHVIRYRDRTIDLKPYFEGFPFFNFIFNEEDGFLYYFFRRQQIHLYRTELKHEPDLQNGRRVSELDFSVFNSWDWRYHAPSRSFLFLGDENNDERINIYRLDIDTGAKICLTKEEYIYGYGISSDENRIYFTARERKGELFRSTLRELDLSTGDVRNLWSDLPEWTLTWSNILEHVPSGRLICGGLKSYDRNHHNFYVIDPRNGKMETILPDGIKRAEAGLHHEWLDSDTLLYYSDEDGFINVWSYHIVSSERRQITHFRQPVGSMRLVRLKDEPYLLITRDHPVDDLLTLVSPRTGEVLWECTVGGKCHLVTRTKARLFLTCNSLTDPATRFELYPRLDQGRPVVGMKPFLRYASDLIAQVVHGTSEAIQYETFDMDPRTDNPRQIHAFLLIPRNLPARAADRRAVITAFYGGENHYQADYHIFLQAGFIVLSPALRGSWGFGAEFYALNDRDLGGNEIIDLIYAGRYLASRFGLKESQIGLEGGSHGGYCAMRALTFPPGVNGRTDRFDWGFAISSYGISNIIDYYNTCNIPDWVLQKAGDPVTEKEKLMDRSPVSHAGRATGPLLMVHGQNDSRVPVDQSRQMAAAMENAGKPCKYVEIPGQGHGWRGLSENLLFYREVFQFLEKDV